MMYNLGYNYMIMSKVVVGNFIGNYL